VGSVTSVLDGSGSPEWSYAYEPFGVQRSATRLAASGPDNPLRYAGQFLDATTGLYHMGARQYDAGTGRFTAPDPLGRGAGSAAISGYAYADNQPTVLVDPTGLRPECGSYSQGGHDVAAGVLHAITFGFIRPQDVGTDPSCPAYKGGVVLGLALTTYIPASKALDAYAAARGLPEIGAAAEGEAGLAGLGEASPTIEVNGTRYIYGERVLGRAVAEPGPYHNFPTSFDEGILGGTRTVVSDSYVEYTLPGTINGVDGVFEIGTRPAPLSDGGELITHRFFQPGG
jgi:RHS repeat-associated protein